MSSVALCTEPSEFEEISYLDNQQNNFFTTISQCGARKKEEQSKTGKLLGIEYACSKFWARSSRYLSMNLKIKNNSCRNFFKVL